MVITEQTAQSLTTSRLPVRTADPFFRFEQRVPEPLMVALSVIMMDELRDGTTQRWLTEEDHPLQALALDRQNKSFDISVQIRRTVRQPNDVRSGVLEQIAKLRGELLVAVQDEESLTAQKAVEWIGEIPTDLVLSKNTNELKTGARDVSNQRRLRLGSPMEARILGHEEAEPFAVGTALTGGPPHRSQRALLTHWAPTSGHDAQSLFGIRVQCSMLDDFHQPSVVDGIEESTDVRVEYPVHFLVNRAPLSRQATCRIRSSAFRRSGDRT